MQTLTSKPRIHKEHPGVPPMHGKPTAPGNTVRVVGTLGLLMHEVKKKKISDLVNSSQLARDWRVGARYMTTGPVEEKGEWNFSRMRRNLVFFCFFVFVNGGFPFS